MMFNFIQSIFKIKLSFVSIGLFFILTTCKSQDVTNICTTGSIKQVSETDLTIDPEMHMCYSFMLDTNDIFKEYVKFEQDQVHYREHSFLNAAQCFVDSACKSVNGKYQQVFPLTAQTCKLFVLTQISKEVKETCNQLTGGSSATGTDVAKPKTRLTGNLIKAQDWSFEWANFMPKQEEHETNETEKGAFAISFIFLFIIAASIAALVVMFMIDKKKKKKEDLQLIGEEESGETIQPKDKVSLIIGNIKLKASALIGILAIIFVADLILTIFTGISAFALTSCNCIDDKMFCNRMITVTGHDDKLLLSTDEGFCVTIKQLKLESGFSCKGGNDEFDNLKSKCTGEFKKIEQDICSHWCPLGQKKGLCQTMEFNVKKCSMIHSVAYDVDIDESLATLTSSVEVKPFCEAYVRMDGSIYCASSKINTINSIDEINFFSEEPSKEKLENICLSKGFINPNSITCHYLWEVGETTLNEIKPQVKFNFIATFNKANQEWCDKPVEDFYCSNTPVIGDGPFYVLSNCLDVEEKRVVTIDEPIKAHDNCMWKKGSIDTFSCNQLNKTRSTNYVTSNGDSHEGSNRGKSSKSTWLWVVLGVVSLIVIIIIVALIAGKGK